VVPSPDRIVDVLKQQKATGGFAVLVDIPLTELRRHAEKAQRKGRAVSVQIRPISTPQL
jgi:hypothetical protein